MAVRQCRAAAGLTMEALGDLVGAASSSVAHWEKGGGERSAAPTLVNLILIAAACRVRVSTLIGEDGSTDDGKVLLNRLFDMMDESARANLIEFASFVVNQDGAGAGQSKLSRQPKQAVAVSAPGRVKNPRKAAQRG